MNRLKGSIFYLSGPMDHAPDGGEHWRKIAEKKLWSMGCGVFNPCDKPTIDYKEDTDFRTKLNQLKLDGNFKEVKRLVKEIVECDLRMLDNSAALIMYIDPDIYTCGTFWEACYAVQQHKPILTFCDKGIHRIPNWLFGVLDMGLVFTSFDSVSTFLSEVDNGNMTLDRKWKFFDFDKVFGTSSN